MNNDASRDEDNVYCLIDEACEEINLPFAFEWLSWKLMINESIKNLNSMNNVFIEPFQAKLFQKP